MPVTISKGVEVKQKNGGTHDREGSERLDGLSLTFHPDMSLVVGGRGGAEGRTGRRTRRSIVLCTASHAL